jgi:acetolactate synthase-1/2/3 large subunit
MAASADDLAALCEALAAAKRPLILTGPAMNRTRAGALLKHLADAVDAPVVAMESPRGLNDPSLGNLGKVFAEADLILSLGKAIDFTMGFGAQAVCHQDGRWLVVSAEAAERDRAHRNLGARLLRCIAADPRSVAADLATGNGARAGWRREVADRLAARSFDASQATRGKITPAALCAVVQKHLDAAERAILISDGGEFGQWAQACLTAPRRLINGPSGAIGGSLCYGIAARKAAPDATVIAMMGDGTAGFHFSEFWLICC